MVTPIILHLDMDAFFAAVEVLDRPELAGHPLVVGGDHPRGVVSTASYEARRYGIHSGMPLAVARRRCPEAVFLPVRHRRYQEVSQEIMAVFHRFTPLVEPLSLDEAFLDLTGCQRLVGDGETAARRIKEAIYQATGLTASAGVASCKLVAKIASDLDKPDGLTVVPPGTEADFLAPLPLERLWGVGPHTARQLRLLGIRTIGDLRRLDPTLLRRRFGRAGEHLYRACRGIDPRPVVPDHEPRSLGAEETFAQDLTDPREMQKILYALCLRLGRRLRRHARLAAGLNLKVRYDDFTTVSRSQRFHPATDDGRCLFQAARGLLARTEAGRRPVRLLGVSAGELAAAHGPRPQPLFFDDRRRSLLNQALDDIARRHPTAEPRPATLLQRAPGSDQPNDD